MYLLNSSTFCNLFLLNAVQVKSFQKSRAKFFNLRHLHVVPMCLLNGTTFCHIYMAPISCKKSSDVKENKTVNTL